MTKVVSSQGLVDFVQSGTYQTIDAKAKGPEQPKIEKPPETVVDLQPPGKPEDAPPPDAPPVSEDAPAEDTDGIDEKSKRAVNRKHREMKAAEALAQKLRNELEETENFSKNQFKRAQMAEEQAAALRAEVEALKANQPKVEQPGSKEPDMNDPKYTENGQFKALEYAKDFAKYEAQKAVAEDRERQAKEAREKAAAAAEAVAKERIAETVKKHPDYHEVMASADVKTHNAVLEYLSASEYIGDISYHLATHPEFVERINKLHPLKAIAEIGKLEAKWETPAKEAAELPKASGGGAPAPIKPLQPTSNVGINTDPAKMSPKELLAYTREKEAARRRR